MRNWSIAPNTGLGGQPNEPAAVENAERNVLEMRALFLAEIEKRRRNPMEDLILASDRARDDNRMSDEEVLGVLHIVLIACHYTTMNTLVIIAAALARFPEAVESATEVEEAKLRKKFFFGEKNKKTFVTFPLEHVSIYHVNNL